MELGMGVLCLASQCAPEFAERDGDRVDMRHSENPNT